MTKEPNFLPKINRIDLIKAKKHRGLFLPLFITDEMQNNYQEIMPKLNSSQQTFLTYYLFDGSMQCGSSNLEENWSVKGGFLQVIYYGYGEYVFQKSFSKIIKGWGAEKISAIVEEARVLYEKYKDKIERIKTLKELSDLYLQITDFQKLDDEYMIIWDAETDAIKTYIENNLNEFAIIDEDNLQVSYIDMDIREMEERLRIIEEINNRSYTEKAFT